MPSLEHRTPCRNTRFTLSLVALALVACAGAIHGQAPMEPEENIRFIEANQLRFGYLAEGQGPLVLLLHGFPDNAHSFEAILPELAAAGYRAAAVFLRGYSPSSIPVDGDYSLEARGRDVLELIEAFEQECAVVVGHDWGASSAYAAASLGPRKVRKLVTVAIPHSRALMMFSPRQIYRARHMLFFQMPWAVPKTRQHDFAYLERLYQRWSPGWEEPEKHLASVQQTLAPHGRLKAAIRYYRTAFRELFKRSSRRINRSRTTVPNLLIAGADDRAVLRKSYERHCNFVDDCRLQWIEDAGHFVHLEAPRDFARVLIEFLGPANELGACEESAELSA